MMLTKRAKNWKRRRKKSKSCKSIHSLSVVEHYRDLTLVCVIFQGILWLAQMPSLFLSRPHSFFIPFLHALLIEGNVQTRMASQALDMGYPLSNQAEDTELS